MSLHETMSQSAEKETINTEKEPFAPRIRNPPLISEERERCSPRFFCYYFFPTCHDLTMVVLWGMPKLLCEKILPEEAKIFSVQLLSGIFREVCMCASGQEI